MIRAYSTESIRAAEAPCASPPGEPLMAQAAAAVADDGARASCRPRRQVPGMRPCCCSSAAATTAATRCSPARRCARRGLAVTRGAVHAEPRPARGLAAARRRRARHGCSTPRTAGRRGRPARPAGGRCGWTRSPGSGPAGRCARPIGRGGRRRSLADRPRRRTSRSSSPSTCPSGIGVDDGAVARPGAARRRDGDHSGSAKAGLLLPPGDGLCGPGPEVVASGWTPKRSRAVAPDRGRLAPMPTSRTCGRCPAPPTRSTARGVVGVVAGSEAYPGAAVLAHAGGGPDRAAGWCATAARRADRDLVLARRHPEVVDGRRSRAELRRRARASAPTTKRGAPATEAISWPPGSPPACRWWSTRARWPCSRRRPPRPAGRRGAHPARGRARGAAGRARGGGLARRGRGRPGPPRAPGRGVTGATVRLKGPSP